MDIFNLGLVCWLVMFLTITEFSFFGLVLLFILA